MPPPPVEEPSLPPPVDPAAKARSDALHRRVTLIATLTIAVLAVAFTVFLLLAHKDDPGPSDTVAIETPEPTGALPAPYAQVHIGMTREALEELFPPGEPTGDCRFPTVGLRPDLPPHVQGAHSRCVTAEGVAGISDAERERATEHAREVSGDSEDELRVADVEAASLLSLAHVRGAARAGTLSERMMLDAFRQSGATLHESAFGMAVALSQGTIDMLKSRRRSRYVAALMAEDCEDVDATRIDTLVRGELDLRRAGSDGARRCRRLLSRRQARFAGRAARVGGGLVSIGVLRSSGATLDASNPRSLRTLIRETDLTEERAAFAVHVAEQRDAVESYFRHAVMLVPESEAAIWGSAVVWFEEDRVSRLMLNVHDDDAIESLQGFLVPAFGRPAEDEPAYVTWNGDGFNVRLDRGAGLALILSAE